MVMFMGSERSGIRLEDYRGHLFRVGELMFNDFWFEQPRSKARELFSSLFHRRFCSPGRAFSETTGYPIDRLSPQNMAAKLTVSTLSDVRNTMFMSGLPVIPASYWPILAPRIKKESIIHSQITVCDTLPSDGWTFLGDASADEMERGDLLSPGTICFARRGSDSGRFRKLDESFESLFEFRRTLLGGFRKKGIPYIEEEIPFVLSRYTLNDGTPDMLVLWNVNEEEQTVHLRIGDQVRVITVLPLDSALIPMA